MLLTTLLAGDVPLLQNPEFWVAVAFVCFVLLLMYLGIPGMLAKSLDARSDAIRREIDDARKLRDEAQALLADYQRRAVQADAEAQEIVQRAESEAKKVADEAGKALKESLERRTRLAEDKIARAEQQAVSEVRVAAVERAIQAAETVLSQRTSGDEANRLVKEAIAALPNKLN